MSSFTESVQNSAWHQGSIQRIIIIIWLIPLLFLFLPLPMKGQLGQQIFIYLWSLLKQMTSCMVWAHPRGRHFNRTLDIFTINFMWRSQRKPFITHNIWLNKGSTERGHCVKIKNKLLFQVLKFWMSVWPKQIKEAVEKERLEEREQSTNWGKEEIREVSFLIGQNWHITFHSFWTFQENQTWILNWIPLSSQNNSVRQSTPSRVY